ncbi:MAG TPA: cation:proton antiporter, partial [Kofleriaceae bacterium]|nr:cation:proton antiporter [Kofleriaceae bacterium]
VTLAFQAIRLPVVLGYVLAGLLIGPHVPFPLVADASLVHVLSELGVILLMFTIGLELPLASIARVGLPGALTALFEVALVVAVATLAARALGFDATTAVVCGACVGISSTMLVAKAFDELGWKGGFTERVFAILVFEDLIAIVLLAIVTAVAGGAGLDAGALASLLGRLAGFLALIVIGGLVIVPRAMRWIAAHARRETLLISALAICFGAAALASGAGYSVALGAFVAGVLIAESGRGHDVLELVAPFRDVFAMVFFLSVGMSIEPRLLAHEAPRILAFTAVLLVTKPLGVTIGTFLAGHGVRDGVRAGVTLAQVGEFSFVIAGVLGDPSLLAIAVGVSCLTTLTSPLLIRRSDRIATWVVGRLPGRVSTFVTFYEGWLARLRGATTSRRTRRAVIVLALDGAIVVAIVIAVSIFGGDALAGAGLHGAVADVVLIAAAAAAASPFAVSMVRQIARLAHRLADEIIPAGKEVDLGRAPRRALFVTFAVAITLAILVPSIAIVQPFVPASFAALLVLACALVIAMARSLADFDGHVRAGSALLVELLAQPQLDQVATILPGFGETSRVTLAAGSPAIGRSLAELDLRARTGATVLAILRGGEGIATPSPTDPLHAGDVLALTGSTEAIEAAAKIL